MTMSGLYGLGPWQSVLFMATVHALCRRTGQWLDGEVWLNDDQWLFNLLFIGVYID